MTAPLLQIRNLSCERDERVLFAGVDLDVRAGELVQVVGPNGAGKTTLLRALTGVSDDYTGEVLWCGRPVRGNRPAFFADLLYLGHSPGVKKALSPEENLAFFERLGGGFARPIGEMLADVGLSGYEDVPCYQLSAGQQRRVALARLYGSRARIWVLDEPFTAVDKGGVAALERQLADHLADDGCVVLTTHQSLNMPQVSELDLCRYVVEVA